MINSSAMGRGISASLGPGEERPPWWPLPGSPGLRWWSTRVGRSSSLTMGETVVIFTLITLVTTIIVYSRKKTIYLDNEEDNENVKYGQNGQFEKPKNNLQGLK